MPKGALKFMALLIVGLVAIAVEFVLGASSFTGWIARNIPNPKNAPFVMGFGLFAAFTALFAKAFERQNVEASSDGSTRILWVCVAGFIAAAYWFATTSGGKV